MIYSKEKYICYIWTILSLLVFLSNFLHADALLFQRNVSKSPTVTLLSELDNLILKSSENPKDKDLEDQIKDLMLKISKSRQGDQNLNLPGKWELIYTTEKEVNFFKTSWPFAKVSSITQELDPYGSQVINNSINFEGGGQFKVLGSVTTTESDSNFDRVQFEFTSAQILAWDKTFTVPPVGAGWFDTMYCTDNIRLSQDVRNDWSVFRRLE